VASPWVNMPPLRMQDDSVAGQGRQLVRDVRQNRTLLDDCI
jgi:hypothetical protein